MLGGTMHSARGSQGGRQNNGSLKSISGYKAEAHAKGSLRLTRACLELVCFIQGCLKGSNIWIKIAKQSFFISVGAVPVA